MLPKSSISGQLVLIQIDGIITLSTGDWDVIATTTGGLAPGEKYYLNTNPGSIRVEASKPSTSGDSLIVVLIAISATQALIVNQFEGFVP